MQLQGLRNAAGGIGIDEPCALTSFPSGSVLWSLLFYAQPFPRPLPLPIEKRLDSGENPSVAPPTELQTMLVCTAAAHALNGAPPCQGGCNPTSQTLNLQSTEPLKSFLAAGAFASCLCHYTEKHWPVSCSQKAHDRRKVKLALLNESKTD